MLQCQCQLWRSCLGKELFISMYICVNIHSMWKALYTQSLNGALASQAQFLEWRRNAFWKRSLHFYFKKNQQTPCDQRSAISQRSFKHQSVLTSTEHRPQYPGDWFWSLEGFPLQHMQPTCDLNGHMEVTNQSCTGHHCAGYHFATTICWWLQNIMWLKYKMSALP